MAQLEQKGRVKGKNKHPVKIVLLLTILILLIGLTFAITNQVGSFSGKTNPFNISFSPIGNQTVYLDIPRYAYVKNVSISIEGYKIT